MTKWVDWTLARISHVLIMVGLMIGIEIPPTLLNLLNTLAQQFGTFTWQIVVGVCYFLAFIIVIEVSGQLFRHYAQFYQLQRLTWHDLRLVLVGYLAIISAEGLWTLINRWVFNETITANNVAIYNLMSGSPAALWMMLGSTLLLTPIAEELIFRGVLMNLFFNSPVAKVLLSGLVFGLVHRSDNLASFLIYFSMGLLLAAIYQVSGKIQAAILTHFLINLGAMLSLLPSLM